MAAEMLASASRVGTHADRLIASHLAGSQWKETDSGLVYRDTGTGWEIWNGAGQLRKTADQDFTNSAAMADVTDLAVPVEAGEEWEIEARLRMQGSSATHDWKLGWSGPGGTSGQWGPLALADITGSGGWVMLATTGTPTRSRTFGETFSFASAVLAGADVQLIQIRGFFVSGGSGLLRLRCAQVNAEPVASKVMARSILLPRRTA